MEIFKTIREATKLLTGRSGSIEPRPGSVAMFHIGRCGSTVLADLLKQHPGVHWADELFAGDTLMRPVHHRRAARSEWVRSPWFPHSPFQYLGLRMQRAPSDKIFGFETKYYHVRLNGMRLEGYLKNLQLLGFTRFIRLTRRNTLRKVVSALVGTRTEQYHRRRGQASKSEPVSIDLDRVAIEGQVRPLLEVLRGYQEDEARIRGLLADQPLLELEYEADIQASPLEAYRKSCSFLSLEPVQATVRLVRTNPHPLGALITNLDEVKRALSGSGFEWMLEEDG